jgi:hypothetical protein
MTSGFLAIWRVYDPSAKPTPRLLTAADPDRHLLRCERPSGSSLDFDGAVGADAAAHFDAVSAENRDRLGIWEGEAIDVRNLATAWRCSFA